jgi:hypothetical protein
VKTNYHYPVSRHKTETKKYSIRRDSMGRFINLPIDDFECSCGDKYCLETVQPDSVESYCHVGEGMD